MSQSGARRVVTVDRYAAGPPAGTTSSGDNGTSRNLAVWHVHQAGHRSDAVFTSLTHAGAGFNVAGPR